MNKHLNTMFPDFFKEYQYDGRPFLMVGMGPSFSRIHDYPTDQFNILGINKVVREIPVDLCHIIDHYIVDKVKDSIVKQAKHLVMPYYPHFGYRPHPFMPIEYVMSNAPESIQSKLLAYNLVTTPIRIGDSPVINAMYFNAEASLDLIANLGCKTVKAIGIDGGTTRATEFSDHGPCDPRGFDLQWKGMAGTIIRHGIDYSNLDGTPLNPNLEKLLEPHIHRLRQ